MRLALTMLTFILLIFHHHPASAQIFVNATSPCQTNCNGSSWALAYSDLQEALQTADGVQEIWVAKGTYIPHTTDREVAFVLNDGIQLYGGFAGTESSLENRDLENNPTILSGDLAGDDGPGFENIGENAYTIIYTQKVSANTIVDGFIIKGGHADNSASSSPQHRSGAGWYNDIPWGTYGHSSPTIRNCTFESNIAQFSGGALFNSGSVGQSYTSIFNCTFKNNRAEIGGAIYNEGNNGIANPEIVNCQFIENHAVQTGGAMYNFALNEGDVTPRVVNTVFSNNTAHSAAGFYSLVITGTSFSSLTNCTFYGNYAGIGGALYLNTSASGFCEATITNTIFWGSDSEFDPFFHYSGDGTPRIYLFNSIVDAPDCSALIAGANQVNCNTSDILFNVDPLFVNAEAGDFHLMEGSPAIDVGINEAIELTGVSEDIDGEQRIMQDLVDLGVDEWKMITDTDEEGNDEEDGITDIVIGEAAFSTLSNPTDNELDIIHYSGSEGTIAYRILNLLGQSLQEGRLNFVGGRSRVQLNPLLTPGLYLLQLEGQVQSIKFVKQ